MTIARFGLERAAFTVLSILAISACGAGATDNATSESHPTDTLGAEIPGAQGSSGASVDPAGATAPGAPPAEGPPGATPPLAAGPMPYRGINLAGAEFGSALPGSEGKDYSFPTTAEVDYYLSKGMNTFRVGFKWERLQHAAYGNFDVAYASKLFAVVAYAASKGAHVILNPHNFARYYGSIIGSAQVPNAVFADFWRQLSQHWAATPNVMFNLVNEPNTMPTEQWVSAANAAIAAIRSTGATNTIVVPGNGWTGAHSWAESSYGTPNAVAMLAIADPIDNVVFEAHQYMDGDSSGSGDQCMTTTIGAERLVPFVNWLKANNKRGMIGELAGGPNATCFAAVDKMLAYAMASSDVLVGWLWWAGGPGWGSYAFSLEPTAGVDKPQMTVLSPYLTK